ncbi:lung seven transmembrane receptor-domain-containing protein [Cercophora newfieldiana]|uniref:Lung seven transmembrane receptor-domain-containing protein n=1 Tax=Cercophora newfieldiana TaxID=92897 RepID=A0AA39Y867_9PEZI|nr:lung seven transmembrane receptor-domain-containing protein [Cercophora newfieldiana]
MRSWAYTFFLLVLAAWTARALEVKLDNTEDNNERCAGMYSRGSWGGPVDPFILVKFTDTGKDLGDDPVVSLLMIEWMDLDYVGITPEGGGRKQEICRTEQVAKGYCNETDIGEFILAPNATDLSRNVILTKAIHLKDSKPINYPITKTGYYCVITTGGGSAEKYEALVEFRNAYGELPATQIPKLPFYGGITILYALVLVFWGFLYFQHRADILAVQNYITAILIFLVIEMLMTWGFYADYLNRNGSNVGSRVLLIIVAILNAGRNSFSFFLLLIVCMGYGVVKPTLGKTMIYVRWLAIVHFVFGLVYAITGLVVTPDNAGPFVLLIVLPLAGTLTAFYVWTLNSLNFTLKDLRERKQHVKESMYRKLWWCILLSIIVIFAFFFFNSFSFVTAKGDPGYVPFHWKSRWFVLDGWPNLVYLADVAWVAYVWRPTANNRRFAMSDEIAQEDDGTFEIANLDIGNPDESDDEEARVGSKTQNGATAASNSNAQQQPSQFGASTSASQSQQQQRRAVSPPRDSLDGETIFAVGEDDKFSDDEGSGEESGLVRGGKK